MTEPVSRTASLMMTRKLAYILFYGKERSYICNIGLLVYVLRYFVLRVTNKKKFISREKFSEGRVPYTIPHDLLYYIGIDTLNISIC